MEQQNPFATSNRGSTGRNIHEMLDAVNAGIPLDGAVPEKSVGRVMEINAISQERCTEIRIKFLYNPTFDVEPILRESFLHKNIFLK